MALGWATMRDTRGAAGVTLAELLLAREVEQFLLREAELLDERRFDEWLELLAEDVQYWMPMRRNVKFGDWERENTRAGEEIAWFDEDKRTLSQRVAQLLTGVHWAEEPISRVCHMVSGVQLLEVTPNYEQPQEVVVKCRFLVYRNRQETETDLFVGKREDRLRRMDDGWRIAERKIFLDQNVLLAKNLTVFF
jgi:3-phenylpropionate/cinnamic acid dioxygenase small subunit